MSLWAASIWTAICQQPCAFYLAQFWVSLIERWVITNFEHLNWMIGYSSIILKTLYGFANAMALRKGAIFYFDRFFAFMDVIFINYITWGEIICVHCTHQSFSRSRNQTSGWVQHRSPSAKHIHQHTYFSCIFMKKYVPDRTFYIIKRWDIFIYLTYLYSSPIINHDFRC